MPPKLLLRLSFANVASLHCFVNFVISSETALEMLGNNCCPSWLLSNYGLLCSLRRRLSVVAFQCLIWCSVLAF